MAYGNIAANGSKQPIPVRKTVLRRDKRTLYEAPYKWFDGHNHKMCQSLGLSLVQMLWGYLAYWISNTQKIRNTVRHLGDDCLLSRPMASIACVLREKFCQQILLVYLQTSTDCGFNLKKVWSGQVYDADETALYCEAVPSILSLFRLVPEKAILILHSFGEVVLLFAVIATVNPIFAFRNSLWRVVLCVVCD